MKNKALWITGGLLLVTAVVWAAAPGIKKALAKNSDGSNPNGGLLDNILGGGGSGGNSTTPAALDYDKLLQNGSRGAEVAELQKLLNNKQKTNPLVVDGIFGAKTENKLYSLTRFRSITLREAIRLASLT